MAVAITQHDQLARLGTALILVLTCWGFIDPNIAYSWALAIVGAEIVISVVGKLVTFMKTPLRNRVAILIWTINWAMFTLQLGPTILLAQTGALPLFAIALVWVFAKFIRVSHAYAAFPIQCGTLIFSLLGATVSIFFASYGAPVSAGTLPQWTVAGLAMVVYMINISEAASLQNQVMKDLDLEKQKAETRLEELEFFANHDFLTGLLNRPAFEDAAVRMLPRRRYRDKGYFAYFLLDLDGFKPINDSYSHEAGDTVLKAVAKRLKQFVGSRGVVARLGGDEFAVALSNLPSIDVAIHIGEEMAALLKTPIKYGDDRLTVGASVGIALTKDAKQTVKTLAADADQAMFQAKNDPSCHARLFDASVAAPRLSNNDRESLKLAMREHQILPYFQPKIALQTGEITGFEALARWEHPTRGLMLPGKFLPSIHQLGLHGDFLLHTTECVLEAVTQLLEEGLDPGQVSVNVPEVTLATLSGREEVLTLIGRYPQARQKLTFEVTEDVFIARAGNIIQESITVFRKAGIRISLDDFGTGFASFKNLRELEFDELKLDTAFVRDVGQSNDADVLVQGFLDIGNGLNVTVIAEGVETPQQLSRLRRMGCEFAQGFLFGKAQPIAEARLLLLAQAQLAAEENGAQGSAA